MIKEYVKNTHASTHQQYSLNLLDVSLIMVIIVMLLVVMVIVAITIVMEKVAMIIMGCRDSSDMTV